MQCVRRSRMSVSDKAAMWERWKRGESLSEIGQPRRQHRGGPERDAAGVECFLRLRQARAGHDAEFAQDIGRRDAAVAAQRPVDQHRHTEVLQQECQ